MDKIGERECSVCSGRIPVIDGLTTNYICQQCGSVYGVISSDSKKILAFCVKCSDSFFIPSNQKTSMAHICGSSVLRLSIPFASHDRKVILRNPSLKRGSISIIIVTWNNCHLTRGCVESIRAKTNKPYKLIFVDNRSTDDTVGYLQSILTDDDLLICLNKNQGFSKANNIGLRFVQDDYVCFLNNDTVVIGADWLEILYNKAKLKSVGLVGPTLRKVCIVDNQRQFEFDGDSHNPEEKWAYLEGWCLFGRTKFIKRIGEFDERFFVYSEDVDLSFKVKENGKKIESVDIPLRHIGHQSSSKLEATNPGHSTISNRLLYRKWVDDSLKSILIIRRGAIGDVLYTTPIIRAIAKRYPNTEIFFMTSCPQLIWNNPRIKIVKDANISLFERVIRLNYEEFPDKNLIDIMAIQAGFKKLKDKSLEIYIGNKEAIRKKKVTIHTGRTWKSREWPINYFRDVVSYIKSIGYDVFELGDRNTILTGIAGTVDARECSWDQVTNHIRESDFFFGLDSSPSVIAKAVKTPAFIIYGCVDPSTRYTGAKEYPLWDDTLECKGCRGRVSGATVVDCAEGHHKCLTNITPKIAIEKIEEFLENKEEK